MSNASEKSVGIADLKARLSEHLRAVRKGRTITVLDHKTPIARVVPFSDDRERLVIRPATRPFGTFRPSAPPKKPTDSLKVLQELRRERF